MTRIFRWPSLPALFVALAFSAAALQASSITYSITDLGTLPGTSRSIPVGINNRGQVAGYTYTQFTGEVHVILWQSESGMQDVGTLGVLSGFFRRYGVTGINDTGQVIGFTGATVGRLWVVPGLTGAGLGLRRLFGTTAASNAWGRSEQAGTWATALDMASTTAARS